jgi:ribosomal protein S7
MKKISFITRKFLLKKKLNKNFLNIKFSIRERKKKRSLFRLKLKVEKKIFFIKHNKKFKINLHSFKLKSFIALKKKQSQIKSLQISRNTLLNFKKRQMTAYQTSNKINYLSYNLYNNFLLFIFKTGGKNIWSNKFASLFDILSLKLQYSKATILLKIFTRLFTRVEVKKVKSRKRVTYIPFFIKLPRSLFLALKWIFLASLKKKGNISFKNKLYSELLQILTQKSSFSLQKVEENNMSAFKNRSNIHYRWQKTR